MNPQLFGSTVSIEGQIQGSSITTKKSITAIGLSKMKMFDWEEKELKLHSQLLIIREVMEDDEEEEITFHAPQVFSIADRVMVDGRPALITKIDYKNGVFIVAYGDGNAV